MFESAPFGVSDWPRLVKECFKEELWEQLRPQNELKTFLLSVKGSSELETIESKIQ